MVDTPPPADGKLPPQEEGVDFDQDDNLLESGPGDDHREETQSAPSSAMNSRQPEGETHEVGHATEVGDAKVVGTTPELPSKPPLGNSSKGGVGGTTAPLEVQLQARLQEELLPQPQQEADAKSKPGIMSLVIVLVVSCADTGTTVATGFQYLAMGREYLANAIVTFTILGVGFAVQAWSAWGAGEGLGATLISLIGAKKIFDTFNVVYDKKLASGVNPLRSLTMTRSLDIALDSIPQLFFQSMVLVQLKPADRGYLLWGSALLCALSVSSLTAQSEADVDTSVSYRKLFARVHGYMPDSKWQRKMVMVGIAMYCFGYMAAKMQALSILATVSPFYTGVWLVAECTVLWVCRYMSEGTFRFFQAGLDSKLVSTVAHILLYMGCIAAPMPILRFPGFIGPTVYLPWILYTMAANPVVVMIGLKLDRENRIQITEGQLYQNLGTRTAISILGFGIMMAFMNPSHRCTFFGRLSLRKYIDELWNERVHAPIGEGIDASRAHILKFSKYYWPSNDTLRNWLEPSWDGWEAADPPPVWFSAKFKQRVATAMPPEALPLAVLKELAKKHSKRLSIEAEIEAGIRPDIPRSSSMSSSGHLSLCLSASHIVSVEGAQVLRAGLVAREKKRRAGLVLARAKQVWAWIIALALSYIDLISTATVGFQYLALGEKGRGAAHVTFGMLAGSQGIQALATCLLGQGKLATLVAMCGGKPLWDTYHAMYDKPIKGNLVAAFVLTITRSVQVVFDSLPQAATQAFLVAQLDPDEQSWLMVASIVGCVVSIAYLVATTEQGIDTSEHFQTNYLNLHGYIPTKSTVRQALTLLAIVLFVSGFLGAKLIALVMLAKASFSVAVVWCSIEAVMLFKLRYFVEGRIWRHHLPGLSGAVPSLLTNAFVYLGMLAAPFPFLRFPGWCGPRVYSMSVVYNLAINPVMVYTSIYLGVGRVVTVYTGHVWAGLAISSGVAVLGMVMMGYAMNGSHRHLFYKHLSMRDMIDRLWEERMLTSMVNDTKAVGLDASRADTVGFYTSDYWVSEKKLSMWLVDWDRWEVDKPAWFTMKELDFQNRVMQNAPVEALPRTALLKIIAKAGEGRLLRIPPEADTDQLVAVVQELRNDMGVCEQARRLAKAVMAKKKEKKKKEKKKKKKKRIPSPKVRPVDNEAYSE